MFDYIHYKIPTHLEGGCSRARGAYYEQRTTVLTTSSSIGKKSSNADLIPRVRVTSLGNRRQSFSSSCTISETQISPSTFFLSFWSFSRIVMPTCSTRNFRVFRTRQSSPLESIQVEITMEIKACFTPRTRSSLHLTPRVNSIHAV